MSSQRPTWQATGSARRPVTARTSRASASHASSLRLAITTSAPARARPSTISRPRPREPPVTTATRSVRSNEPTMESSYPSRHDPPRAVVPPPDLRPVLTPPASRRYKETSCCRDAESGPCSRRGSAIDRCRSHADLRSRCHYFQRLMNSAVAGLTSSGFEALRKCWPPSTTRSSAPGLLTNSCISSSALATE